MKLRVNQNHYSGVFKKRRNQLFIKIGAYILAFSLYGGALANATYSLFSMERLVAVSQDVRRSMYTHNTYFDLKDYNTRCYDSKVTTKALRCMKCLQLDARRTTDFGFLAYCTNLEELVIKNAQDLSIQALETLSQYKGLKLELNYFVANIWKDFMKFPDGNFLEGLDVTIKSNANGELEEYIFYNYIKDATFGQNSLLDNEKYQRIDQKLNNILEQIDFSEAKTQTDVLLKLIIAVGKTIKYDAIVAANPDYEKGSAESILVRMYNKERLSFILTGDGELNGVCSNYATLLSALCYKVGIESYFITGVRDNNKAHAWNLVGVDGAFYYVDVTRIDANMTLDNFKENVLLYEGVKEYWDEKPQYKRVYDRIVDDFIADSLYDVDPATYSAYSVIEDVEMLMTSEYTPTDVTYCNLDCDGKWVNNSEFNAKVVGAGAIFSASVGMLYGNRLLEADTQKRVLKRRETEEEKF